MRGNTDGYTERRRHSSSKRCSARKNLQTHEHQQERMRRRFFVALSFSFVRNTNQLGLVVCLNEDWLACTPGLRAHPWCRNEWRGSVVFYARWNTLAGKTTRRKCEGNWAKPTRCVRVNFESLLTRSHGSFNCGPWTAWTSIAPRKKQLFPCRLVKPFWFAKYLTKLL